MPNLVGPSLIGAAGPTSNFYTTPFPHKPGDKARDKDGNEYVFCDFTAPAYYGQVVQITPEYLASPLLGTARVAMRVGVVMGGWPVTDNNFHGTSDHGGWVLIYGLHQAVQTGSASDGLTSDNTVAYVAVPQTSVGTPSGAFTLITPVAGTSIAQTSTDQARIYGMWVVPGALVSDFVTAWPSSATSGPATDPIDPSFGQTSATAASFDNTSAFIGATHVCYLNYPYVTGIEDTIGIATT